MMPNNKENEKRLAEIISAVDTGRAGADKDFLERLRVNSVREFEAGTTETQTNIWGVIMKSKITKFAAIAAVMIAAIIFSVIQFGGSIDGASIAWADVVKPILNAQTAIFTMIIGEEGKSPPIQDMVMGSRIRRTVEGIEAVSIIDLKTSRALSLDPKDKKAVYIDLKGLPKMPNPLENLRNVITMLQEDPQFVVEELGEKVIDGTRAIGFRAKHPEAEVTIWADGETALPIRLDVQDGQLFYIIKDFQFDVEMDESLFSMDVPEGYSQKQMELDLFGSTEADFIEGLRIWTEVMGGGTFPDDVSVEYFIKQVQTMQKVFAELDLPDDEETQLGMKLQKYLMFIRFFKGEGKWYYAGKGVALGDAEAAIFWYRPKGSELFRVIYGDLTVKEVSPQDLPQPLLVDEQTKKSLGVQQWSKPDAVGRQEDQWHILASGMIEAHSQVTLTKIPQGMKALPISLPYPSAELQSVTLGETAVEFSQSGPGRYDLELTPEKLAEGPATFEAVWTMPLETIKTVGGKYHTELKSLIPIVSYKLLVILSPDSGFVHTSDPSKVRFTPFTWGSQNPGTHFGSCGIAMEESD